MGIARFYRWLSERYPLINEVIDVDNVPEFDNLYLDMNGIIHNCSHGNTGGRKQASENHMWLDVFKYISGLVYRIKPRKLLYLAVDGVAPRAKMNQQRSRRFRAAHDAKVSRERSAKMNDSDEEPNGERFDSNCITPGTEFMERLVHHLEFFVKKKIAEDPLWRDLKVVLSGPEVPGEGEHKIMDFIRSEKSQPGFDANTRHCLYGLDADLIMLSLASHEPYFALLREEIDFGFSRTKSKESRAMIKPDKFQLLHVGILREYLALDFIGEAFLTSHSERESLLLLDRIIDDFIMFCFLVGNDFLPHLPFSEIGDGGLNKLFTCYKELMRKNGKESGHFLATPQGTIDYSNLFAFLEEYMAVEYGLVDEILSQGKWAIGKKRTCDSSTPQESLGDDRENVDDETLWESIPIVSSGNQRVAVRKAPESVEAAMREYYEMKLGITSGDSQSEKDKIKNLVLAYLEGLQWVYSYYFKGPPSWDWYYPYHYAPFGVDIVSVLETHFSKGSSLSVKFEKGTPFLPFQQLMAVLPPASGINLLPKPLYDLMINPDSPIRHCYPEVFEIDVDGVRVPWGGVTIIPFVDEKLLIKSINETLSKDGSLTDSEKFRNSLGDAKLFHSYSLNVDGSAVLLTSAVSSIPSLLQNISDCKIGVVHPFLHRPLPQGMEIFPHHVLEGYSPKTHEDFASLFKFSERFLIDFSFGDGVRIFNSASKQESLFLSLSVQAEIDLQPLIRGANSEDRVAMNFPFYSKRLILTAINDGSTRTKLVKGRVVTEACDARKHEGDIHWLLSKLEESGIILNLEASSNNQTIVELIAAETAESAPPVKALACMTFIRKKNQNRIARVSIPGSEKEEPRDMQISLNVRNQVIFGRKFSLEEGKAVFPAVPSLDYLHCLNSALAEVANISNSSKYLQWISVEEVSLKVDLPQEIVWSIFGEVWIRFGKFQEEVGMNLWSYSSTGEPQCVPNFSRFTPLSSRRKSNHGRYTWNRWDNPNPREWTFSSDAVEALNRFIRDFPQVFQELRESGGNTTLQGKRLLARFEGPQNDWANEYHLGKIVSYVNASRWRNMSICAWSYEALNKDCVGVIDKFLDEFKPPALDRIKVDIKSVFAMNQHTLKSPLIVDPFLGQRGIYVKENGLVPIGTWGTVIGVYGSSDVRIDILLDEENMNASSLSGVCSEMRGLRISPLDWRGSSQADVDIQDAALKADKNKLLGHLIVTTTPSLDTTPLTHGIKISVDDLFGRQSSSKPRRPLPPTALVSLPQELTTPQVVPEFLLSKLRRNEKAD